MALKSLIDGIGDLTSKAIKGVVDSQVIPNTAKGIYNKAVKPIGKALFDTTLKTGANTLEATANVVEGVRNNQDTIKKIGKGIWNGLKKTGTELGYGVVHEGSTALQAGATVLEWIADDSHGIMKSVGIDKSMIGKLFTGKAKTAIFAAGILGGTFTAGKDYLTEGRTGYNDGQLYRLTPTQTNPYQLSSQMASSQMGHSYADNGGATGDLVFALNNMRHG